jgi:putative membrane protein
MLLGLLLAAWAYRRGQTGGPGRPADSWRARCFGLALATLGVALLSPLDALSGALASAHMVQHLLLLLVAAPLLALSAPPARSCAAARWPCGGPAAAGGDGSA